MFKKTGDWLDARTGYRQLLQHFLMEPIPGRSRWILVTGSGVMFAFGLQVITGILLAMYFSPSSTDAWASVWYIQNEVTFGWLIRGLHHFGASAMIVLCLIHMVQVFVYGAYKTPRELNWVFGLLMFFLVLGLGLTGYLLPWDQKGYWATRVATGIMGTLPLIGPHVQVLAQGGAEYGNLTLTRFYALHVLVLPGAMIGLIVIHLYLFRRHGVTTSPRFSAEQLSHREMFWPAQIFKDSVFMMVILAVLLVLVVAFGAPLDSPADPGSNYEARPDWYFLFLFQLLKYFEGPMVLVGTVVIPTAGALFLFSLPFLDRSESRSLRTRWVWMLLFFGFLVLPVGLTGIALYEDITNEQFQAERHRQQADRELVLEFAKQGGIDGQGRIVLYEGYRLFEEKGCVSCHAIEGRPRPGTKGGPDLTGFLSREWFHDFLVEPKSEKYFGGLEAGGEMEWDMPNALKMKLDDEEMEVLTEMLISQTGLGYDPPVDPVKVEQGREIFMDGMCSACHSLDPDGIEDGPSIGGYGSFDRLKAFLQNPGAPHFFGDRNTMPATADLTPDEMNYLVTYLQSLQGIQPKQ
jgi:quinol-cytochrome oxidoreductase complex cytochrome b subunit/mono/diheme cytochrome c family protein